MGKQRLRFNKIIIADSPDSLPDDSPRCMIIWLPQKQDLKQEKPFKLANKKKWLG